MADQSDSDDGMDAIMDNIKKYRYKNALEEENWEEEFEKIPMFMKEAPEEIDPQKYPELASIQAIIHDTDRSPEEQAESLKDEGNQFFKEKKYEKAVQCYTAGLLKKCKDPGLDTVLLTNRAAAQFYLGNIRSSLRDAEAAKKLKPDHLKALIRGAQCCVEMRKYPEAVRWCDEGLKHHATDKKLQELRCTADRHKRATERDVRKAKVKEKKQRAEKETLLAAIKDRGVQLFQRSRGRRSDSDEDEEGSSAVMLELRLDGLSSQEATGAQVFLDQQGALHWPVLFLYPEHQQSDFISAFCENNCFVDHLAVMFGQELPPWDEEQKYHPQNLQIFFEDEEKETFHQVDPETSLLQVLQHKRFFVKAGTPSFVLLVKGSPYKKQFLSGKKTKGL